MALEVAAYVNALVSANPPAGDPVTQADDHLRLIKGSLVATFPNLNGPVTSTPLQLNSPFPTGGIISWYGTLASIPAGWGLCDGTTYAKADGTGNIVSPDLRSRFLCGAWSSLAPAATGGAASVSTGAAGGFTPTGTLAAAGSHNHTGASGTYALTVNDIPSHAHNTMSTSQGFSPTSSQPTWAMASQSNQASGNNDYIAFSVNSAANAAPSSSIGGGAAHGHAISTDGSHVHTFTGTAQGDHTHTVATLPPFYALAFIIKL